MTPCYAGGLKELLEIMEMFFLGALIGRESLEPRIAQFNAVSPRVFTTDDEFRGSYGVLAVDWDEATVQTARGR